MAKPGKSSTETAVVALASTVGAMAAATVARRTLRLTWKAVTGQAPPDDPKSRDTDWVVALMWAVASGAAVGVARMLVERQVISRLTPPD